MNSLSDEILIDQAIRGNRDSFSRIVERYQTLVCSLTYGSCGDLARSEDLAQETFLIAWKRLTQLKDREKFRAWLCAIARNLCRNFHKSNKKKTAGPIVALDRVKELEARTRFPCDQAIRNEEQALTWETLETIPEIYREPLILFYRRDCSVRAVAEALDISPDTARQRLSRGRSMLKEKVARIVETTLNRSRPTKAFTVATLMALPALTPHAAAAGIALTAAKGSTAAKAAATISLLGAIGGPILGLFGGYLGTKASIASARSSRERRFITRLSWMAFCESILFAGGCLFLVFYSGIRSSDNPKLFGLSLLALLLIYSSGLLVSILWAARRLKQIREEERDKGREFPVEELEMKPFQWNIKRREYRTKWSLLGLPLLHYVRGERIDGVYRRGIAIGWIAIGDISFGALLSLGGFAMGGIAIGGVTFGVIGIAGIALGGWVFGGLTIGWMAYGGLAVAWHGALGGAAIARDFAIGGMAIADQVDTEQARLVLRDDLARSIVPYLRWSFLLAFVPPLTLYLQYRKRRKATKLDANRENNDL